MSIDLDFEMTLIRISMNAVEKLKKTYEKCYKTAESEMNVCWNFVVHSIMMVM